MNRATGGFGGVRLAHAGPSTPIVLTAPVPDGLEDKARRAVANCPEYAISISE